MIDADRALDYVFVIIRILSMLSYRMDFMLFGFIFILFLYIFNLKIVWNI